MDFNKLARYCELKEQQKRLEDELESIRKDIVAMYAETSEVKINDYTLKIIYQEKKQFNDQLLFEALPDPELWKNISKVDPAKISALLKADIITGEMLEGTYSTIRIPYVYVSK
ncbi:hypothetical protein [Paenibacillus puerhi]|uniref:hypothetical protein n=1 Tax=Paenibacillus puerhi TaxID=2692622 RepID=UPI001357CF7E|nr:hypothetical protein [Paenibacillus puerhi]